ncbi:MAG TPA: 50S ribosomal protein L25 [Candidatus Limnocylindrales bacterium]|nr:50S ribosomal protein L25 [Candidatus Limnocylindrales bacterium]
MKRPVLKADPRTILGKKIKTLRREGILPGNVYGKGLSSIALQVQLADFEKVHKEVGDTGLIELDLNGKTHPVLVKNLQLNYKSHTPLHADFYQVNMKEKVKATVPLVLVGEAKAVTDKVGLLLQTLSDVEIEALPDHLAENIEVNVEHLAAIDDHILVGDLKAPEGVEILSAPDQTVVKIAELVAPEPEPEPEAETAEGEEAPAEGDAPKEGEAPAEGGETKEEATKE